MAGKRKPRKPLTECTTTTDVASTLPTNSETATDSRTGERYALTAAVVVLTLAAVYTCVSQWAVLLMAAWTADIARPLLLRLQRLLKGTHRSAAVLALLLFLVITLPVVFFSLALVSGANDLKRLVLSSMSTHHALETIVAGAAEELPTSKEDVLVWLQQYGSQGINVLSNIAGAAAEGTVSLFLYLLSAYVFLTDGPAIWKWIIDHSPLAAPVSERLGETFTQTGRGLLLGVGITSITQGLVATLIYFALGIPRWWVLGPITGIASMLPVVGSALVWAPIAAGLVLTNHPVKATTLAVLGVVVIGAVDNILRPVFSRLGALNMPTLMLFISIFGGMTAFGTWGALLGPLLVQLWVEVLKIRRERVVATSL